MSSAAEFYFSANAKEVVNAINGIQGRLRKLEKAGAPATQVGEKMGGGFNMAAAAAGTLRTALGAVGIAGFAAGALKAVGAIREFGASSVAAAAEMQTYSTRFSTLLGDTREAEQHLGKLTKYAAETPFEMAGISKASATLLAFGVDARDSMEVLRMLGDVAAASGGDLGELAHIYGKVNTAGKMDTVDINQLADRALNIRQLLADRDGLSMDEVKKNISSGAYGMADLRWAIEQATGEGGAFFGGAANLSKTFNGLVSTLNDNINMFKASLGEVVLPALSDMLKTGIAMVGKWGDPLKVAIVDLGKGIRNCWQFAKDLAESMLSWHPAVMAVSEATEWLLAPLREMSRIREEEMRAQKELVELAETEIYKTQEQIAMERQLAHEAQLRKDAEEAAAEACERSAAAAKREREERKQMRAELAKDRAARETAAANVLFGSQNAEGMRNELKYRYRQATGQEWSGYGDFSESAMRAAEDAAAKKNDTAALAELKSLREYNALYQQTLQAEIDENNRRQAALDKAREAEVYAAELADAHERGDMAAVQRLESTAAADRKYAELRAAGMSHEEAANWAAGAAAREYGAKRESGGPGEWLRDDLAAIGGGGAAIRIPNAQLAIQKQQLSALNLQTELLKRLVAKPSGMQGIPVVP